MDITVYTFEDADGNEFGSYTTQNPSEAQSYAALNNLRCLANTFVFHDREVAWDFTNAGENADEDDGNPASDDSIEDESREP